MTTLPDDYRERAKEQRRIANALLDATDVLTNPNKLVSAIVGQVNATVFESMADTMDYLRVTTGQDSVLARRRLFVERNDAIRKAAAQAVTTGDWNEFDRIVAERPPTTPG